MNKMPKTEKLSLVNNANLVHNLFLVYLSISTCFGRLCAHHQEKQLCLWDTWYLSFCVDDCLVCTLHTRQFFLLMMGPQFPETCKD